MVREFKPRDPELYRKGIELRTAVMRRWGFRAQDPKIKASQFMNGVLAFLDKGDAPADELLFLGQNGVVAEGSISNIFIVREKRLLTPDTASGILRGVTRGLVTELAQKRKIPFVETLLTRHEIYNAEECFITNTSSEILPVTRLDGRLIGGGAPGPVTRRLAGDFKKKIDRFRHGQN